MALGKKVPQRRRWILVMDEVSRLEWGRRPEPRRRHRTRGGDGKQELARSDHAEPSWLRRPSNRSPRLVKYGPLL